VLWKEPFQVTQNLAPAVLKQATRYILAIDVTHHTTRFPPNNSRDVSKEELGWAQSQRAKFRGTCADLYGSSSNKLEIIEVEEFESAFAKGANERFALYVELENEYDLLLAA